LRLFGLFGKKTETSVEPARAATESWPPDRVCAHAQRLIDSGDVPGAYEVLQTGVSSHPDSADIRALFEQVQKHRLREQIGGLKASLQSSPDPVTYAALVDAHIADGDNIQARQLCTEGIQRYPDDPTLCLRMGQLWFSLFREGAIAKNAQLAISNLERCIEKDPRNRQAHETLIQLYTIVGAPSKALRSFAGFMPSGEMQSLFTRIVHQINLPEEDLGLLLREFERNREPGTAEAPSPAADERKGPEEGLLRDVMDGLAGAKGHLATALVDANGQTIKSKIDNDLDDKAISEVVDTLSEVAKSCCARMGIGVFEDEKIQGPNGSAFIKAVGDLTLFVFVDKKARAHEISNHLAKLSGTA